MLKLRPRPFDHPTTPHVRRHGPRGYAEYQSYKDWLRDEFQFRCVYCLQREVWSAFGQRVFSVEHIIPQSSAAGLPLVCDYHNLLYACVFCNSARQDYDLPLVPTIEAIGLHLFLDGDAMFEPRTEQGRDMIGLFHLNRAAGVKERRRILDVIAAHESNPADPYHRKTFEVCFGYPDELPDLTSLRPPDGNGLSGGAESCYHAQRKNSTIVPIY